ncbi:MAG: alkaline phosphatase D family protein [Kofleriaceae bacterium]
MKRRDFLRSSGWFVVGASLAGIPGCGDNLSPEAPEEPEAEGTYAFPQGVASGDPRANSVVVWTRATLAATAGDSIGAITVRVQIATDASFAKLLTDQPVTAAEANDHTIRVLITGLLPATSYYYRFVAGQDSIFGRTRTAPDSGADTQVNLAWVSCQDYSAGHYGAYRQLLVDDAKRADADKIHAVVHLGDMIYETRADGFQTAIDDKFEPITLTNRDGSPRAIETFPSGGGVRAGVTFAATVADYRHLYKTFLSDPDLQAARARWPFIAVWDDHEFTDDCWQSQANYTNTSSLDEADQTRRVSASQAWFEYVPVQLTGADGVKGVPSEARDFSVTKVDDARFSLPNDDNFVDEPNNVAAIGAITIYRSLRFGKHVELVMTDERSYRSDHAIPEDISGGAPFLAPRNALPLPLVDLFDAGKTANDGMPPASITLAPGVVVPNLRAGSPAGTMLGKAQKAWWKATMKGSDATWKLWGNEVTLMRLALAKLGPSGTDLCIAADAWDGYHSERKELMGFLKTEAIKNVIVLTGDVHASFAGTVMDDFNLPVAERTPVATELVASGISSNSLFSFFEAASRGGDPNLRGLVTGQSAPADAIAENFNLLLLNGPVAAGTYAASKSLAAALDPKINLNPNPHLKYADTNAQGYGYVKITGTQVAASIITINRPITAPTDAGPGVKRTVSFTIKKDVPGDLSAATVTGTKPFPLT